MNISELLTTATSAGADAGWGSLLTLILPLGLMVLFFYFFLIRPEKKRNKEMQDMLNNIQVADEVITNGVSSDALFLSRRIQSSWKQAATEQRSAC